MRRYFFAAFTIAALSILATSLLYESGVLSRCAEKLATYYANLGLIQHKTSPVRIPHYLAFSILGCAIAWAALDIPKPSHKGIIVIGTMLLVMTLSITLLSLGIFFEPFSSLFAILVAASLSFAYSLTEPGSRKALLQQYLGDRISQDTLSGLLSSTVSEFLEGRNCKVTVLCLRVFNLAALRSALPPSDLVEITGLFLRHSAEFLARRGAYLDESAPGTVRAFFGLAGENPSHAILACKTAHELDERLTNLNHELEARFFQRLDYGIALASGDVTTGRYHSAYLSKVSAIGNLTEYAHRLCCANAAYGSHILVNAETYNLIRETYSVRPMELMFDAANELMAEAYELLQLKDRLTAAEESTRERFWQGVILYREGRAEEALQIFSALQAERPQDRPLSYFIERAQSLLLGGTGQQGTHLPFGNGHARVLQCI